MSEISLEECTSMDDVRRASADMDIAKAIGDLLWKHYPGWLWCVTATTKGGVATVVLGNAGSKWGFYLHLKDIDVSGRAVIKAGGEILERFNLARSGFNPQSHADLEQRRTISGRVLHET